ncbi:MAG: glycerophosphodiester phosphodiesterase [Candidatus Bathyarchaeia archaeon]
MLDVSNILSRKPFTIVAHRGASGYEPENTLRAFRRAIDMKADMIEADVRLSKDGIPVVIHNGSLDRTAGVHG